MDRRPPLWVVFLGLLILFAVWALLRPPLQTPDEPQHLLKATAVRLQPWFNDVPDRFRLDARSANPLALETPPALDKLFFRRFNAMTAGDIAATRPLPWRPELIGARPEYERAIATYPQPYYWAVFLLAQPLVAAASLTPWDATYAYRLATCLLAAVLWTLVWWRLAQSPALRHTAVELFAFTVATPMLAFISSGVNPDAVNIPLCALAILGAWRLLDDGSGGVALAAALLGAMLTKPSGLQLAAVLVVAAVLLALLRQAEWRRAIQVAGIAIGMAIVGGLVFYLWQPPRFLAGGPVQDSLRQYLVTRTQSIPEMWRMYWGQLGWLDYFAAAGWYRLVALVLAANVACLALRPRRPVRPTLFLALVWVVFVASTFAGELRYLREAGYTFQGRYLLPAAVALGCVLFHEIRGARLALLGAVAALHVALIQATVTRYFVDGWSGVVQALPFR